MTLQDERVVDDIRKFFLIVRDEYQGLVPSLAESLDNVLHQPTVHIVKSVEWLVEDEQFWILYEGACQ